VENREDDRNNEVTQTTASTGEFNPESIVIPSGSPFVEIPAGRFFENMQLTNVNACVSLVHEKSGKSGFWKRQDWTLTGIVSEFGPWNRKTPRSFPAAEPVLLHTKSHCIN
jgi:hypothetical protein